LTPPRKGEVPVKPYRSALAAIVVAVVLAAGSATAAPGDRTTHLVSLPGNGAFDPLFDGTFGRISGDGTRVWFTTLEPHPGLGDTDAEADVYERSADGTLRLITMPGGGAFSSGFGGASQDGTRVFFATDEPNAALGDTDTGSDVYERDADGSLLLISPPGGGAFNAVPQGISRDGTRIWFMTNEPNPGLGDTDAKLDSYERGADGTLRLLTTPGAAAFDAGIECPLQSGVRVCGSQDGTRVLFYTFEPNAGLGDTDANLDAYERSADGTLRLITTPGTAAFDAILVGASQDGARILFTTFEPNPGLGDNNVREDVYERFADGTLRLVTMPGAGSDQFFAGASRDGTRVFFTTRQANPALGDTDSQSDVYERSADGTLRLITPSGGDFFASFVGTSWDGKRVFFSTSEPNAGLGDTDAASDVYERNADGTVRLISLPGNGPFAPSFGGVLHDGTRAWFTTPEPNSALGDIDVNTDLYERTADGSLRLVIPPPGVGTFDTNFVGASQDGARVLFSTTEPNAALGDTDMNLDIYEVRWSVAGNVTPPVLSGVGETGRVSVCAPGVWAGDGFSLTTEWLRDTAPIAGQTAGTYTLTAADSGHGVSCRVTATNIIGSAGATSNTITVAPATTITVAPGLTRRVVITGASIVGTRLACDRTGIHGATATRTTWRRAAKVIATTATYRVRRADLGKRLTCQVEATNPGGTLTSTSRSRLIPTRCRVPALRGKPLARARERAGLAGCRTRTIRKTGTGVTKGAVLRTNPAAKAVLPHGATVTLTTRR
jgi:PASTA domain